MRLTSFAVLKKVIVLCSFICSGLGISSCFFSDHTMPDLPLALWGVLDLREVDFYSIETIPIAGELEFYWHAWEAKGSPVYIWGPRGWKVQFPPDFHFDFGYGGYGTYRFVLLLPNEVSEVGLYLPLQHSAYSLWIDGRRVATNGRVGSSPSTYKGEWKPQVIRIPIQKPALEFVLQVSDFSMNTGGYFHPLRIGLPDIVENRYKVRSTAEVIAFGVLMFVGLYCFLMYIVDRKTHALLFLGIASFLFALRTITHGEMVYTSFFSGEIEWLNKIRYITLFLLPVILWGFFRQLQGISPFSTDEVIGREGRWLKAIDIGMGILSGVCIFITTVTPSRIFVPLLSIFPLYVGLLSIAILYLLVREILQHKTQGWILLVGFCVLIATVVRDLHIASNRLWDNSFYSPFGYVFFILSLAIVLGKRFTFLLEQQRLIAQEREEQAQFLESLVQERTRELQEANSSLAKAVEAANAANEAKGKFLAMMSHEIRTPMNVVVGITELLERTPLDTTQIEYVQTLRTAAEGLLVILNDVLDLSRLEAGTVRLEAIETNLAVLMQEIAGFFRPLVEKKGLYLRYSMDPACPHNILVDPTRLKQVLTNLIGNAVKFTSCGGVQVFIRAMDTQSEQGCVQIEFQIIDTGIGIPKDRIHTIFESFVQADSSITRRFGGTGLGLTISKRLVDLMGGDIRVSSTEGKGSTFTFSIVARKVPDSRQRASIETTEKAEEAFSPMPIRILMVEDNEMNRMVGEAMIQSFGWKCVVASNGLEAIRLLQSQPIDLVLMDVEMPEMDGIETTRRIRAGEAGEANKRIPIVALSAHILPEIQQKATAVGVNGYLTKPIHREKLYRMAYETLPFTGGQVARPEGKESRPEKRLPAEEQEKVDHLADGALPVELYLQEEIRSLIEKYNGNQEFVIGLYRSFAETITNLLPQLEEALKKKDLRIVWEGARTLLNIGLLLEQYDVTEPLTRLQSHSHRGDLEACLQVFREIAPLLLAYRESINLLLKENGKPLSVKG